MSEFTDEDVRRAVAFLPVASIGMQFSDAEAEKFDRWLAAHDAEVRAGVVTEEPEWVYGSAIREQDGGTWDHEYFTETPITAEQLREWNEEHAIGNDTGSVVISVRRSIPRVEEWVPVKQEGADGG